MRKSDGESRRRAGGNSGREQMRRDAYPANTQGLESDGNSDRRTLIRLKGYFLCQHDVARYEIALRHETPGANDLAEIVELLDIRLLAVVDSVNRPAIATDDLEISILLVRSKLRWREPLLQ
jgi:hypothetical protein